MCIIYYLCGKILNMKNDLSPEIADQLLEIGNKIRELRKVRTNYNYKELSKEIGIGQNTYLRIEKGNGDYNIGNLIKILNYYGDVNTNQILKTREYHI